MKILINFCLFFLFKYLKSFCLKVKWLFESSFRIQNKISRSSRDKVVKREELYKEMFCIKSSRKVRCKRF